MEKRIVTHSELQAIKDCPQKWSYKYVLGYVPNTTSLAIIFGNAIHNALEAFYSSTPLEANFWAERALNSYFQSIYKTANIEFTEKVIPLEELALSVFYDYRNHYLDSDFQAAQDPITGKKLVETEFLIPVITPAGKASKLFQFAGKVDMVVENGDGEYWIVDHKTRATIADNSFDRLIIDQQMRAYAWAMSIYLGKPIAGCVYNLIRKKKPGQPKINKNGEVSTQKCDTTFEIFKNTLEKQDAYLKSLSEETRKTKKLKDRIDWAKHFKELDRLKGIKFFDRGYQEYNEADLKDIQAEIYQATMMLHGMKFPYKNDAACDHWGGCSYKAMCMGMDCEGKFTQSDNLHKELDLENFHKPRGKGYDVKDAMNMPETMGMESILDAVNA